MARQGLYRGFSSFEFQDNKTFSLRDVDLVKLDLLNHIFTVRGSRVMMPSFGTEIPLLAFEPLDVDLLESIEDELRTVFDYDPRVELLSMEIIPNFDESAVVASAQLFYIELDLVDDFELNIQFEG